MEKTNFINIIVSIFLILSGASFCLYVIIVNSYNDTRIALLVIGILLIVYGIVRMILTNRAARHLS